MVQAASCTGNSFFNKGMGHQFLTALDLISVYFKLDKLGGVSQLSCLGGLSLLSISAFVNSITLGVFMSFSLGVVKVIALFSSFLVHISTMF